ncbi:MAG TPA: hypothetical protein PKD63_00025 [Solirubrobacteraceae bacterium]|nr:hypothetical protein [Solirubrobacteraceae bacterium]
MQGKVSVGLATVTGYSVSTVAFVAAVLAYLGGDHSDQTVAIIGCGVVGALAFVVTNIGRYWQAKVAIQNPPAAAPGATALPVYTYSGEPTTASGSVGSNVTYAPPGDPVPPADPDGPGDPLPHDLADVPAPAVRPNDVGDGDSA